MDGLDICVAKLSIDKKYNLNFNIIGSDVIEYKPNIKKKITSICSDFKSHEDSNYQMGEIYLSIIKNHDLVLDNCFDGISIHGQTVLHIDSSISIQLGHPKPLFDYFKTPIYFDFRKGDIEANGNGAPLVPFLDFLLYKNSPIDILTVNIGGISNITLIPKNTNNRDSVIGFDVGPGMYLIDKFTKDFFSYKLDFNGKFSKNGKVDVDILRILKKCSFITKSPPKSIHTNYYDFLYKRVMSKKYHKVSNANKLRTLIYFTAYCIHKNIENFVKFRTKKVLIYLNGGGSNHPSLVSDLNNFFLKSDKNKFVFSKDSKVGSDIKESFLMCVLGFSKSENLFSNMPNVTGSKKYLSLGEVYVK